MIYELAELSVVPVERDRYMRRYVDAWADAAFAGAHDFQLLACIEDPAQLLAVIEWDNVEAHLSQSDNPRKVPFRAAIREDRTAAVVLHYEFEELIDSAPR